MKVKVLASQGFLERILNTLQGKKGDWGINFERSGAFIDVFGKENYGFVLSGDLRGEIDGKGLAPVYGYDENFNPLIKDWGVESELFLPSAFSTNNQNFPSREEIEKIMNYLESKKEKGFIGNIVNSKRGTLFEDKLSILKLQDFDFKIPKTYHFNSFEFLYNFVNSNKGDYIFKHRFGQEGIQLQRINHENLGILKGKEISDFVLQERLNTLDEKRLIFFDGELIASRVILDRSSPWERGRSNNRLSKTMKYLPTPKEIRDSLRVMDYSDTTVGCVDWVETEENGRYFMELNGFGTGYGKGKHPYNVNKLVAEKLRDKYLLNFEGD